MSTLNEILTFEHESEHVFEHNLLLKKQFSTPKIYTANGDLKKRWYVYFSYRNPDTGKLQRMKNIYGKANTYKTKENRLSVLTTYSKRLQLLLNDGYNPFKDNTDLFINKRQDSKVKKEVKPNEVAEVISINEKQSIKSSSVIKETSLVEGFDKGLKLKQNLVSERTLKDYKGRVGKFINWINEHFSEVKTIEQLTKKMTMAFLNDVQVRTSARNRNNYRIDLGSIMQVLEDNEIMLVNFMRRIPVLKTKPERHKRYTAEMQEQIFNLLEKEDPILLLYIKFISYNLLRPIEVCRLRVKDIDLKNNTVQFKAKNSTLKTKIIPKILKDDLPDISKLKPNNFLFTASEFGGQWDATETNRRDYFTKRFKKVVKDHFNLGNDYGLYSFRHTYITKLYRQLEKEFDPNTAKSKLMQITGHLTMDALEKYLRNIDAQLPADYSELLK
ncbi:tyrosine-type recombinase/integrase [Pontimicrobium sp. IMCC45349]|uniref:tyrosine-type recombinase/integrase n=1 Tax=Pontimicrobium sp. IMCC45349 TaxID=3391574 RepID=UPI00399F046B